MRHKNVCRSWWLPMLLLAAFLGGTTPVWAAGEVQVPVSGYPAGYILVGGKQTFLIYSISGYPVQSRFEDIRNRIVGVIQPGEGNTAIEIKPEDINIRLQGIQPVIYLKDVPVVTVTNEDAANAHTDPPLLANAWANELKKGITNYQVGQPLSDEFITMKLISAPSLRIAVPPGKVPSTVGQVEYWVKNGVVTLKGAVESFYERAMAEMAVGRIPGVTKVVNNIEVKQTKEPVKISDTDLQKAVGEQLVQIIRSK